MSIHIKKIRFNPMEHLNPVDQARQLAARGSETSGPVESAQTGVGSVSSMWLMAFLPAWKKKIT